MVKLSISKAIKIFLKECLQCHLNELLKRNCSYNIIKNIIKDVF